MSQTNITVLITTRCTGSRTKEAVILMTAKPINPPLRTASPGCRFNFTSCASQLAITMARTAPEQQSTACAVGLYHDVCVLLQRESTRAAGARAAKKARNKTGRILRSSDMGASGTALKYSPADIGSTRQMEANGRK